MICENLMSLLDEQLLKDPWKMLLKLAFLLNRAIINRTPPACEQTAEVIYSSVSLLLRVNAIIAV